MKLRAIAHSRTGDKGNISNISLIVYRIEDYPKIADHITADKVKDWFRETVRGQVRRYELPQLGALNFVMERALGGGVLRSLAVDKHGKSLGSALLEMEIPD